LIIEQVLNGFFIGRENKGIKGGFSYQHYLNKGMDDNISNIKIEL